MAELVIRGGTAVDGTGEPGRRADVAIDRGRISEIGDGLHGECELDASGCVVAPGFVDVHTHYDAQVFWDPALTPSCYHGVTTVIAGNCGFTLAPCRPEHRGLIARTLEHVEDMPLAALEAGIPWDFETFPEYLDSVERHGVALNYAAYVGHTAVRLFVMGDAGYERSATDTEIATMQEVVADAMLAGAVGFATSTSPTHNGDGGRPVPSRLASVEELVALTQPLRDLGRGVVEITPGEAVKHAELPELARKIGVPLTWSPIVAIKDVPVHERLAEMNAAVRAEGYDMRPQVTCRPIVFQVTLAEPFGFGVVPIFAELIARSHAEKRDCYADAEWRARAQEALDTGKFLRPNWANYRVAESENHPELEGRSIADLAAERGMKPLDVMAGIALEEDLRTRFDAILANDDEDGIFWLLRQPGMLIGLSDSGAHVGQICDARLFTEFLGTWVRDRGVLPIETAVHRLTGEPADFLGLHQRGLLREGYAADVTVFDPDTVAPGSARRVDDFPAGAERLTADAPSGMRHVVVNGTPIRVDEEMDDDALAERPGHLLRLC